MIFKLLLTTACTGSLTNPFVFRTADCGKRCTGDSNLGRDAVERMKMPPEYYDLLSLLLTFRSSNSKASLGKNVKSERRSAKTVEKQNSKGCKRIYGNFAAGLLFVLRSTDILRSLNKDLGRKSIDRFSVMADSAMEGLEQLFQRFFGFLKKFFSWLF